MSIWPAGLSMKGASKLRRDFHLQYIFRCSD